MPVALFLAWAAWISQPRSIAPFSPLVPSDAAPGSPTSASDEPNTIAVRGKRG